VVLSSFVAPFSTSALGVSLPLVARDLGVVSVDSVEALVALTLAVAVFVLPLGRAADLLGHVVVFRMGLLLAVAGFALASLSPNFLMLCGALAVGGVGLAAVFGSNNALLFQAVAPDRRASAVGINSMSVYLGLLTGPFLGGFLAQVSWRVVFLPALALLLASVVLAGGPSPRQGRGGESFDWVGAALLALSLALVVLGVSAASPLFTGLGLAALVFTGLYNRRKPRPLGRGWEKAFKDGHLYGEAPLWGRVTRGAGPGSSMTSARGAAEGRARALMSRPKGNPLGRGGGQEVGRGVRWLMLGCFGVLCSLRC
jgi:DHA2 family multidrug resistance protein-like MFS transporter